MQHTARGASARRDRGAAIVEFALVFPVFMMLAVGIFTGGIAYNRKLSMTNGAREAARFGATMPVAGATGGMTGWLDLVAGVAVSSAEGEMDASATNRSICVSYVYPQGSTVSTDKTTTRRQVGNTVTYNNTPCFSDGQPNTVRRVQIVLERTSDLQALVFTRDLTLESKAVVRFEAVST